ncbi:MAG: aminotransferase class V-fold PLP-dependent enzyme [Myxococcales bacterium]|nr:aminotransferase class V-fold PLP-dependent enzyme [Myxococcales bacterium]
MIEAFEDAAAHVDDKWARVLSRADRVRRHVARRIGAQADEIALGANTHELVARFLSGLDWRRGRHLVTTEGEFHSMRRQLLRLAEAGVEVHWEPVAPVATLAARLAAAVRPDTVGLLASTVLFQTSTVVPGLAQAAAAAVAVGAQVLFDAYHAFDALPFTVAELGGGVFVTAGGYKYAQWGEGCCWLRVPPGVNLRPVFTGWFSDFEGLADPAARGPVGYGPDGAHRFAGSTFEPTSVYRAAAVCDFFEAQGMTVPALRATSLAQTARLLQGLEGLPGCTVLTPREGPARGGFVAVQVAGAARVVQGLRARGVFADARGDVLRLGPAPYLLDADLQGGLDALRAVLVGG